MGSDGRPRFTWREKGAVKRWQGGGGRNGKPNGIVDMRAKNTDQLERPRVTMNRPMLQSRNGRVKDQKE